MRTKHIIYTLVILSGLFSSKSFSQQHYSHNYIVTRTMLDGTNTSNRIKNIQYFDGMGKFVMNADLGITPERKDLLTLQEYDEFGREAATWLPAVFDNSGQSRIGADEIKSQSPRTNGNDSSPYSYPVYESSPLSRIKEQFGAGHEWHSNGKSVKIRLLLNVATSNSNYICNRYEVFNKNTLKKSGTYAASELYITEIKDEDNNLSYEFKDKTGQILLTRQINNGSRHDTYYVYDVLGNLCFVLPPLAADLLQSDATYTPENDALKKYAYIYQYDKRRRCTRKKLPGADWIHYVYDKNDRLIFTQTGEQRVASGTKWSFNIPDKWGRSVISGVCNLANSVEITIGRFDNSLIQAEYTGSDSNFGYKLTVNGQTLTLSAQSIYTVNYYDNYKYRSLTRMRVPEYVTPTDNAFNTRHGTDTDYVAAKGLLTGSFVQALNGNGWHIYSSYYYDVKGRMIQRQTTNHLQGEEKEYIAYNFTGEIVKRLHEHIDGRKNKTTELYTYEYDHALRLKRIRHKLNNKSTMIILENHYDELGRIQRVGQAGGISQTFYEYNIRSWTKSISSGWFKQTLSYNEDSRFAACYNGNIAGIDNWNLEGIRNDKIETYKYNYDNLSRLTSAHFFSGQSEMYKRYMYSESMAYDKQGNITSLERFGSNPLNPVSGIVVDKLKYQYNGNQVKSIKDTGADVYSSTSYDFKDYSGNVSNPQYTYDLDGRLTKDPYKGITINYNLLDLPSSITVPAVQGYKVITYAATGEKLKTFSKWAPSLSLNPLENTGPSSQNPQFSALTVDYVGNKIYKNGTLDKILIPNGYIENEKYFFYVKDYQGNNKVVMDQYGMPIQQTDYYPFGLPFSESTAHEAQPYKYNDKEFDTMMGINLLDYHARNYDPAIGRFTTMDPSAEKYYSVSPYVYCKNNPINRIDPDGKDDWVVSQNGYFTKVPDTKSDTDYLYILDENGDRLEISPLELDKGILDGMQEYFDTQDLESLEIKVHKLETDNKQGTELFEHLSNYTNVEWSHTKTDKKGGTSYILTSHELSHEKGFGRAYKKGFIKGKIKEHTHNHPKGTTVPSDDDKNFKNVVSKKHPNATFYIYTKQNSLYTPY